MGFLPVFFPPEGCLGHAPVHTQPLPVDALQAVIFEKPRLPQGQEDAVLDPLLKAVVGGRSRTELGGVQGFPLTAGAQDEENGIHAHPVWSARPTSAEAVGVHILGEVHLDFRPQVIWDAPVVSNLRSIHEYPRGQQPAAKSAKCSCKQLL